MKTAQGVVTPPREGRWGEMAAFGFPLRLRNRGLSTVNAEEEMTLLGWLRRWRSRV